jgi:hypothetical protein
MSLCHSARLGHRLTVEVRGPILSDSSDYSEERDTQLLFGLGSLIAAFASQYPTESSQTTKLPTGPGASVAPIALGVQNTEIRVTLSTFENIALFSTAVLCVRTDPSSESSSMRDRGAIACRLNGFVPQFSHFFRFA